MYFLPGQVQGGRGDFPVLLSARARGFVSAAGKEAGLAPAWVFWLVWVSAWGSWVLGMVLVWAMVLALEKAAGKETEWAFL